MHSFRRKQIPAIICLALLIGVSCGCTAGSAAGTQDTVSTQSSGESLSPAESTGASEEDSFSLVRPDTAANELERAAYASIDDDIDAAIIELQRRDYVGVDEAIAVSSVSEPYVLYSPQFENMDSKQKELCVSMSEAAREYGSYSITSAEYGSDVIISGLTVDTAYHYTYLYESSYSALDLLGSDSVELMYFDPDGNANDVIETGSPEMDAIRSKMTFMEAVINRIIQRMPEDLSTYQKYYYLGLVLCSHCEYDTKRECRNAHTAYGALTQGKVVCEGYAMAYQLLCEKAGLYCILESGYSNGSGHMWNLIALESGTYHVDLTWADSYDMTHYGWFSYFACSEEENEMYGHTRDAVNSVPATGRSLYE